MADNNYCACNGGDADYIIELNQQGPPGVQGPQGEPGYSPVATYTMNNDTIQFTLINADNTQTTPNFYDYLAKKSTVDNLGSTYLRLDGSNAGNTLSLRNLAINNTIEGYNANLYISNKRLTNGSITLTTFDGNINLNPSGGRVYIRGNQVVTQNDLPAIGNATITIKQNGATKGTFTTNQSSDTTIELDSGISNPLVIENDKARVELDAGSSGSDTNGRLILTSKWQDTVDGEQHSYERTLSLSNGGRYISYPDIIYRYKDTNIDAGSSFGRETILGFLNLLGQGVGTTLSHVGAGAVINVNIDNDTIKVNQSGQLYADVQSGSSYTAGAGIDITNDVISIDNTVVTTTGTQTLSNKTFEHNIIIHPDERYLYSSIIAQGDTYTANLIQFNSARTIVGNNNSQLYFNGSLDRPGYNNNSLALYSDIPDVSNFVTNSSLATTLSNYALVSSLPDMTNYYTKTEVDNLLQAQADLIDALEARVTALENNINGGNA